MDFYSVLLLFKQKTAYELRISDWSSDVCSSDLFDEVVGLQDHVVEFEEAERLLALQPQLHGVEAEHAVDREMPAVVAQEVDILQLVEPVGLIGHQIGRASCRERVCQYV